MVTPEESPMSEEQDVLRFTRNGMHRKPTWRREESTGMEER